VLKQQQQAREQEEQQAREQEEQQQGRLRIWRQMMLALSIRKGQQGLTSRQHKHPS
jgi:hypothetical protein